jgi:hypothetical protein
MRHILKNHTLVRSCEDGVIPYHNNNLLSVTFPLFLRRSSIDDSIH